MTRPLLRESLLGLQPQLSGGSPVGESVVVAERDRLEANPVAGGEDGGRIAPQIPQERRGAADEVPAAGALQRVDGGQGGGDGDGAGRHGGARGGAARQHQLGRQVAEVGVAGQEAHHVDVVGDGAVALDHLVRREARARCDLAEIGSEALVIADRKAPEPARVVGRVETGEERRQALLKLALRHCQGIVVDHEGAEGWDDLDDTGEGRSPHARGQRQHQRADAAVHPVAELDRQRGIAAGRNLIMVADSRGTHSRMAIRVSAPAFAGAEGLTPPLVWSYYK